MVKALEEIGEQDSSWRIELLMLVDTIFLTLISDHVTMQHLYPVHASFRGLALSYLDTGLKEEATKALNSAIQLARRDVPDQMVNLLKFQVRVNKRHKMHHHGSMCPQIQNQLGDLKSCDKDIKASPELHVWNKLYKLKRYLLHLNSAF